MKVEIKQLRMQMKAILMTSGAPEADVDTMVGLRLEQDLHGNFFSGVAEVEATFHELTSSAYKKARVEVDMPGLKLINAMGRSAKLVGTDIVEELATMAKRQGIAIIGVYNGGYNGMMEPYARALAQHDVIAIVSSNGGPQGTVPYGGSTSVMGTNPLSYAIPTDGLPIVFDAATSKYPFGAIEHALARNQKLPEKSFLDKNGQWTTDPKMAEAIVPFGEHKGYAINLLLDVMTGALVRAKSGTLNDGADDIGTFYIAIDPAAFGGLAAFKQQTTTLAHDIESVIPAEGYDRVAVPGYTGERLKQAAIESGYCEIDDIDYAVFKKQYDAIVGAALD